MSGEPVGSVDLEGGFSFPVWVDVNGEVVAGFSHEGRNHAGPVFFPVAKAVEMADLLRRAVEVAPVIASAQAAKRAQVMAAESQYERIVAAALGEDQ